jgi:hypothetical protein
MGTSETYCYRFFGRLLRSGLALPELTEIDCAPEPAAVSIVCSAAQPAAAGGGSRIHHWRLADGSISLSLAASPAGYLLTFPDRLAFFIEADGSELTVFPYPPALLASARHQLLDQVLPRLCAHFFRDTVIHGSMVAQKDQAICFLGETGLGKSTLAAAMGLAGYRLATDDCLRLMEIDGLVCGQAAYPSLRLLPDAMAALGVGPESRSVFAHHSDKSRVALDAEVEGWLPIRAFFVLGPPLSPAHGGKGVEISPLDTIVAFSSLMANSFSLDVHDPGFAADHFSAITSLVGLGTPCFMLRVVRDFGRLGETVQAIESAVRAGAPPRP